MVKSVFCNLVREITEGANLFRLNVSSVSSRFSKCDLNLLILSLSSVTIKFNSVWEITNVLKTFNSSLICLISLVLSNS